MAGNAGRRFVKVVDFQDDASLDPFQLALAREWSGEQFLYCCVPCSAAQFHVLCVASAVQYRQGSG